MVSSVSFSLMNSVMQSACKFNYKAQENVQCKEDDEYQEEHAYCARAAASSTFSITLDLNIIRHLHDIARRWHQHRLLVMILRRQRRIRHWRRRVSRLLYYLGSKSLFGLVYLLVVHVCGFLVTHDCTRPVGNSYKCFKFSLFDANCPVKMIKIQVNQRQTT